MMSQRAKAGSDLHPALAGEPTRPSRFGTDPRSKFGRRYVPRNGTLTTTRQLPTTIIPHSTCTMLCHQHRFHENDPTRCVWLTEWALTPPTTSSNRYSWPILSIRAEGFRDQRQEHGVGSNLSLIFTHPDGQRLCHICIIQSSGILAFHTPTSWLLRSTVVDSRSFCKQGCEDMPAPTSARWGMEHVVHCLLI